MDHAVECSFVTELWLGLGLGLEQELDLGGSQKTLYISHLYLANYFPVQQVTLKRHLVLRGQGVARPLVQNVTQETRFFLCTSTAIKHELQRRDNVAMRYAAALVGERLYLEPCYHQWLPKLICFGLSGLSAVDVAAVVVAVDVVVVVVVVAFGRKNSRLDCYAFDLSNG